MARTGKLQMQELGRSFGLHIRTRIFTKGCPFSADYLLESAAINSSPVNGLPDPFSDALTGHNFHSAILAASNFFRIVNTRGLLRPR